MGSWCVLRYDLIATINSSFMIGEQESKKEEGREKHLKILPLKGFKKIHMEWAHGIGRKPMEDLKRSYLDQMKNPLYMPFLQENWPFQEGLLEQEEMFMVIPYGYFLVVCNKLKNKY
ncbi:hypothetical protein ACJX0J_010460 [Zea mays]